MTAIANLNGLFKEKYADKVETLYSTCSILKDDISFVTAEKQPGGNYNAPVIMTGENGFTYAAPSASGGPLAMNAAISMTMQNAQVAPYQMGARWVLDYESAMRSVGKGAFEPAAMLQLSNVVEQAGNRLELSLLYGQEGIGQADSSANVSATSTDLTYSVGSWADAVFGSSLGAEVQFFDTATGALISSGADSKFVITRATTTTRVVRVTGTATGITALDAATAAGSVDTFFSGARTSASAFNEMPGLSKIITNSGTLFNIDASVYDLWKGNSYAVGGAALTFAKLQTAMALPVGKGLTEDVTVYVNPKTWSNLMTEQAALRKFDSSYSEAKLKNGSRALEFYSLAGKMTIKAHPFVKQGDAFVIPTARFRRIGSTDITFNVQGPKGSEAMFVDLQDSMGYQAKLYTAQTLFTSSPAKTLKLTGIVNS